MKKDKIIKLMATWFGLGDLPKAPGTFGTLGGIPVVLLLALIGNNYFYAVFIAIFFAFSVYISSEAEKIYGEKDAQNIVIDEVLGYVVTLFMVPVNMMTVVLAFLLFRFFDITKIYPIRALQKIKGGMGVVIDDFAAGIFANLVLQFILFYFGLR